MPSGKTARPNITDNKDGTVTVRYAPTEKGLHEMDIRYDGNHIPGEHWEHWEYWEGAEPRPPAPRPRVPDCPRVPREPPPVLRGRHQPAARQRLRAGAEPWYGQQALHLHHCHQGCWGG